MNALEITNLCKSYGDFALDDLTLTVPAGSIVGLIGENGAGKSTTIKLILDMIKRDSGNIRVLGSEDVHSVLDDIGVVLDEVGIPACLDVKRLDRVMKHAYKNWSSETFFGYVKKLDLPEGKDFSQMSQGMKMKLGIAAALSHGAQLLILDEATNGLDPVVRDEVVGELFEFTRDENHAILISSHIVSDLEKLCDYIAFIHKGKLMLFEQKDALREKYGVLNCSVQELAQLDQSAIVGKRVTPYGAEVLIRRDAAAGRPLSPVSIEELFIFMVKGEKA